MSKQECESANDAMDKESVGIKDGSWNGSALSGDRLVKEHSPPSQNGAEAKPTERCGRPAMPPLTRTAVPPSRLQDCVPNPPPRPVFNHLDPAQVLGLEYRSQRSTRSHLTSGDKLIQSRNRRRSLACERSLERGEPDGYSKDSLGSTSLLGSESGTTTNNEGSNANFFERRTGSMGRKERYGDRRRFRDEHCNEESPALRRNFSYGSDMENYGVYDYHKGGERVSRRDGSRGRHLGDRHYDDSFRREVYQEIARRYERSQSATRLGYTEDHSRGYVDQPPRYYAAPQCQGKDRSRL